MNFEVNGSPNLKKQQNIASVYFLNKILNNKTNKMKKTFTLLSCLLVFISITSAQSVAGKIKKTNSKINNTDTAVNATSDAINNSTSTLSNAGSALSNFGNTLGGMVKKKHKTDVAKTTATDSTTLAKQAAANTIMISITGADYASLKKLKENLKAVAGVQSVDMNYNSGGSSLSINYNKKADDLWDGLSDDIATHYNIISMNGNTINVAYKK